MNMESTQNPSQEDSSQKSAPQAPNCLNMRIVMLQDLCNWYATERTPSRSLYNNLQKNKAYLHSRPDEALDAVRSLFQKMLDKEIDAAIQRFHAKYLVPAIKNIQSNGYEVGIADIFCVYHRVLDAAKRMYPLSPVVDNDVTVPPVVSTPDTGLRPSSIGQPFQSKPINRHIPAGLRRRKEGADSDTDSDISQASFRKKARQERVTATPKRTVATGNQQASGSKVVDIPLEDVEKWNPDRIDENTIFVLGSKANSALGLSAQRGRIYIKHPGLFKYVGDHEDKMWLFENKQKTVKFGGKAFLVLMEDIVQLSESAEYRNNADVNVDDLNGFTLPPFIIEKIRSKMAPVYQNLKAKYGLNIVTGEVGDAVREEEQIAERASDAQLDSISHIVPISPAGTSEGGSDP